MKYVKISEDVEQDADKLCTVFEGCHIEDVANSAYQKMKISVALSCKGKKDKDEQVLCSDKSDRGKTCFSGSSRSHSYQRHDFDHYYTKQHSNGHNKHHH